MDIKNIRFNGDTVVVRLETQTDEMVGYQEIVLKAEDLTDKTVHELEAMAKSVLIDSLTEEKENLPLELTEK